MPERDPRVDPRPGSCWKCGPHTADTLCGSCERWLATQRERDRKAADYDRLAAELAELKALINDDGSLTAHEEHVDILAEAMDEHRKWAGLAAENERLKAQPDTSGIWRCSCCGEMCDGTPSWRWNGEIWEHKCPGNHPQHGHEPARYFGERPWRF